MTENKKNIVLVLPRGEAIKNFVLSGTAALLMQSARVTIISVIPNKEIEVILKDNSDELHELVQRPAPYVIDNYIWDWLDIVHGRWLWSGAAKLRWKIRDYEAVSFKKKLKRTLQKTFAYPFANRTGVEMLSKVERWIFKTFPSDTYYRDLLLEIKPDLVFNGSHIHSLNSRPVMHAAKDLGIKTCAFLFSWDNLTSQGRIIPSYDYYMVWNDHIRKDLLEIYRKIKPEQISVVGTPQFDFHYHPEVFISREKYAEQMGLDPARPIILYTTGMLNLMPGEEIVVERIADMCQNMDSKPQLLVRVYPKETSGRFKKLQEKRPDIHFPKINWELKYMMPMPSDIALYSNMLMHCELGINVASTVSLELCMFDKPVINIGYNPPGVNIFPRDYSIYYRYDHYIPITESGAVDIAWNENEMDPLIKEALSNPLKRQKERKRLIADFFGPYLDGKSHERIAKQILTWA